MESEFTSLWLVGMGGICIASAIFNLAINLNAAPSIWSGFIYEILLFAAIGVALVVYGSVAYDRARGARTR
jgi:hypothetical protein